MIQEKIGAVFGVIYDAKGDGPATDIWRLFQEMDDALKWVAEMSKLDERLESKLKLVNMIVH